MITNVESSQTLKAQTAVMPTSRHRKLCRVFCYYFLLTVGTPRTANRDHAKCKEVS